MQQQIKLSKFLRPPNLVTSLHIPPHLFELSPHERALRSSLVDLYYFARKLVMAPGASRAVAPALLLVAALVVLAPLPQGAHAALSCSTVYNTLMPCLGYVQTGGVVPRACCAGIQRLVSTARRTPDRRAVCTCLKNVAAGAAGGPYISRAAGLPGRCGVPLPYKISPNVNCNSIN